MNCPECDHTKLKTYDSRHVSEYVVRKRKCEMCEYRFFTVESYMSEEQLEEIENLKKRDENDHRDDYLQENS